LRYIRRKEATMTEEKKLWKKGGGWLLESPEAIYTPEDFDESVKEIARTTRTFVEREVLPLLDRMEHGELELNVPLMKKAGELGLLAIDVPEAYGGLDLPKVISTVVAEELSGSGGFSVTYGAHTSIGTLPLVYFGTEEQKRKYLPKLASGEWIAAYCLTEPGSGSDALAAKTRATLSEDGKYYILNGVKQWISNAGFPDIPHPLSPWPLGFLGWKNHTPTYRCTTWGPPGAWWASILDQIGTGTDRRPVSWGPKGRAKKGLPLAWAPQGPAILKRPWGFRPPLPPLPLRPTSSRGKAPPSCSWGPRHHPPNFLNDDRMGPACWDSPVRGPGVHRAVSWRWAKICPAEPFSLFPCGALHVGLHQLFTSHGGVRERGKRGPGPIRGDEPPGPSALTHGYSRGPTAPDLKQWGDET
jgi:hypothetical protein